MADLRLLDHFDHIEEKDNAFRGQLVCTCGHGKFNLFYKGKRTMGILAPEIGKKHGGVILHATCSKCEKAYLLYDSHIQGVTKAKKRIEFNKLEMLPYDNNSYKIRIAYVFDKAYGRSDMFEEIFVEINDGKDDEWKHLLED